MGNMPGYDQVNQLVQIMCLAESDAMQHQHCLQTFLYALLCMKASRRGMKIRIALHFIESNNIAVSEFQISPCQIKHRFHATPSPHATPSKAQFPANAPTRPHNSGNKPAHPPVYAMAVMPAASAPSRQTCPSTAARSPSNPDRN